MLGAVGTAPACAGRSLVIANSLGIDDASRVALIGALVAHVGDSRAYWFDGKHLQRLTSDHSVVQSMVDEGMMSEAEAHTAPNRHVLTQAIGLGESLDVGVTSLEFSVGDRFLICSDGLSDMVPHDKLHGLFARDMSLDHLADDLMASALAAGGLDNISLALIQV